MTGGRAVSTVYAARAVSKRYGPVVALDRVDFAVAAGEVVGLVGDNGAGKSTLVRILSGADSADSGELLLDGQAVRWTAPHDAREAGIETLYQESGLAPDLTVSDNIFLGREIRRGGLLGRLGFLDEHEMQQRATRELARVAASMPDVRRTVSQLSGGQRQAVAIGRAVAWAKKVVLLDEPTNHLGARQAAEVLAVARQAAREGLGVVFISHTLPHVLDIADRVVVLRLGSVVADRAACEFTHESMLKAISGLA